jgi:hypothetical protein
MTHTFMQRFGTAPDAPQPPELMTQHSRLTTDRGVKGRALGYMFLTDRHPPPSESIESYGPIEDERPSGSVIRKYRLKIENVSIASHFPVTSWANTTSSMTTYPGVAGEYIHTRITSPA